jgi:hypothetical protein
MTLPRLKGWGKIPRISGEPEDMEAVLEIEPVGRGTFFDGARLIHT